MTEPRWYAVTGRMGGYILCAKHAEVRFDDVDPVDADAVEIELGIRTVPIYSWEEDGTEACDDCVVAEVLSRREGSLAHVRA